MPCCITGGRLVTWYRGGKWIQEFALLSPWTVIDLACCICCWTRRRREAGEAARECGDVAALVIGQGQGSGPPLPWGGRRVVGLTCGGACHDRSEVTRARRMWLVGLMRAAAICHLLREPGGRQCAGREEGARHGLHVCVDTLAHITTARQQPPAPFFDSYNMVAKQLQPCTGMLLTIIQLLTQGPWD